MNPLKLLKLKSLWSRFCSVHPKVPLFLSAVRNTKFTEGTIIEIYVKTPEGKNLSSNIKLKASDIEILEELEALKKD